MTLKTYLLEMIISTVVCFVSWVLILFYINPDTSGIMGKILFILMLFFFMTGFFTLTGFYIRKKLFHSNHEFKMIGTLFRQGILFALIFTGMLVLNKFNMLFWWSALLFILAICLLEFYFNNKD
ncbi:hypothetical protein KAK05_00805 [Candidatus Parcubacteria bacterium]|nr:hypothetical protein [Candidatus Parcubacteria bacterium]